MFRRIAFIVVALFVAVGSAAPALADCRVPAPPAMAFPSMGSSCPSGYYKSGDSCTPYGASSNYAFPSGGGSCPSGYYQSGNACLAYSEKSCHAFPNGGGSCPSGYYRSGDACLSY